MTKHTPGPWEFDPSNQGRDHNPGWGITIQGGSSSLVHVPTREPRDGGSAEANARLIAAAPEQNAALLAAPEPVRVGTHREAQAFLLAYAIWYDNSRSTALAKAEGK